MQWADPNEGLRSTGGCVKTVIKRCLFLGLSFSFAMFVALRAFRDMQMEGDGEGDGKPHSGEEQAGVETAAPEADSVEAAAVTAESRTIPFRPLPGVMVTFSGTLVRNGSRFALRETAGALYMLESPGRAWPPEGDGVRVTGRIDPSTRLLRVEEIRAMIA